MSATPCNHERREYGPDDPLGSRQFRCLDCGRQFMEYGPPSLAPVPSPAIHVRAGGGVVVAYHEGSRIGQIAEELLRKGEGAG